MREKRGRGKKDGRPRGQELTRESHEGGVVYSSTATKRLWGEGGEVRAERAKERKKGSGQEPNAWT